MKFPESSDVRNLVDRLDSARAQNPERKEAVTLGTRQIYILPTRHGLAFGILLVVLLLIAINYDNELVYMLTFLLASMAVITFLHTQRNLLGLQVTATGCDPVFAGEPAVFHICVYNSAADRIGLRVESPVAAGILFDVPTADTRCIALPVPGRKRGWLECPPFELATNYPLGIAYAWSARLRLSARCLVYPAPAQDFQRPARGRDQGDGPATVAQDGDDFAGLRPYRGGDSLARINWKTLARGQGWHTKEFGTPAAEAFMISWDDFAPAEVEARLSLMTRALVDADESGAQYGLRLPDRYIAPGCGVAHRAHCLEALALYDDHG